MATPPAASAISLPFRTHRRRYISALIWAALHQSLRKHFHNFSPLAPTLHPANTPPPATAPPPAKVQNVSALLLRGPCGRFTLRQRRRFIKTSLSRGRRRPLCPLERCPHPPRFDESHAGRSWSLMEGAEEAKTS